MPSQYRILNLRYDGTVEALYTGKDLHTLPEPADQVPAQFILNGANGIAGSL